MERTQVSKTNGVRRNAGKGHSKLVIIWPTLRRVKGAKPGLVLAKKIENWSLTSLQQRLVKTGGRLVKHARYYWLLLAESHLTRRRFGTMLQRIWSLPLPIG